MEHIDAIWGLLLTNYSYIQREKSPEELARLLDIWKQLLADVPPELLKAAVLQHMASSKWFPSVAELREMALRLSAPERLSGVEAWGIVKREIRRVGFYGQPDFGDDNIAAGVAALGWTTLCMSQVEMEAADRARFVQCYEAICGRQDWRAALLPQVRQAIERIAQKMLVEPDELQF